MIQTIIRFSVRNKLVTGLLVLGLIAAGLYNLQQLPIDAVPDITNNQVQVVTVSPTLAAQEVEQFITYPIEVSVANIPRVTEIRSISRYGLSVVTVVFADEVPMLEARQFVKEQISLAADEIPAGLGTPELMPITTGLGEIYQYVLSVKPGYEDRYDAMALRTIQDWIVKRQLAGTSGIVETSSFGGYLQQYEVAVDPLLLQSLDVTLAEIFMALERNNQNSGGSYIEKGHNAYYIRTEGLVKHIADIEQIVVANHQGQPVLVRDLGKVKMGHAPRFGAMTMDGKGEVVGGITLMLKGANASEAIANVRERIAIAQKALPEGIELAPYLDRAALVGKTIHTVEKNLLEGGIIVLVVLVLFLGDLRAGLIVASVIPLAMLFAIILMRQFGVSANLMSLGAIDFGIVVDGAVIVIEGVLHGLFTYYVGRQLTQDEMDELIIDQSGQLFRSAVFGVLIILVVFIPIMTLTGIEGRMFRPMALTFSFAVLGALLLSLTYVPAAAALVLPKRIRAHHTFADRILGWLRRRYEPVLRVALYRPGWVLSTSVALLLAGILLFKTLGAEFIPTLEEGDLAMQMSIQPGSSLTESIQTSTRAEQILLAHFPEIKHVVAKIGTAEVPTDPMAIEDADVMIILREKDEWTSARTREELVDKMKAQLAVLSGVSFEFTQPIQLRFNELMTGAKTDIAVKIFGENTEELKTLADRAATLIKNIPGAGDVKVEQTEGLPQLMINFDRQKIAQYGLNIEELNTIIRTAYAGEIAGVVFENERKFDLVVRLQDQYRNQANLDRLYVHLPNNQPIPLSELASVNYVEGPMQISRENARRRINVGINVRNRDIASLVADIERTLQQKLVLPPGYTIEYGGQFENLQAAQQRLGIAVPVALLLIFGLLYFTFEKFKYALMIFTAVPFAAIGGVAALWLRGMPFSISAGVGFIALFGVAVLNGIVLISYYNRLRYVDGLTDMYEVVIKGALVRLRPVLMTATVAALGFLPMALSNSNGAEVQKPLATVVIGGLITATLLTLIVLPVLYLLANRKLHIPAGAAALWLVLMCVTPPPMQAQSSGVLDSLLAHALANHPNLQQRQLSSQHAQWGVEAAREIPATDFELQLGQMNTTRLDANFSVRQGLGNWSANRYRKQLATAQVSRQQQQLTLEQREVSYQVQQAWQHYLYQTDRVKFLRRQLGWYDQLLTLASGQYQQGETGRLEQTLVASQRSLAQRNLGQAENELTLALAALRTAVYLPDLAPPSTSDSLQALEWPLAPTATGDVLVQPWLAAQQEARLQTSLQQSQLKPVWWVGYFHQSIRPDFPLQGIQIGLSAPIYGKQLRALSQQASLEEQMSAVALQQRIHRLATERQAAYQQAEYRRQELNGYGADLLVQADALRRLAEVQRRAGEIDFFRYLQSLGAALDNELSYLDLIFHHNLAILRLQYLQP